jgi:hypothetical protein
VYIIICMWFGLVIAFVEHLEILTTSNYSAIANSCILQFTMTLLSVWCIFTGWCPVTASSAVASSAFMFLSLLVGDCLTTNNEAGGHLTPTSFSSDD